MTITLTKIPGSSHPGNVKSAAVIEAKRATRHPLTFLGAVGSLWLMWTWVGGVAPVLPRESIYLAGGLLPLIATSLLVARDATTREKEAIEIVDMLPTSRNHRTLGIQLGMLSLAGLAIMLQTIGLVYLYAGRPVGAVNWWEVAAGPLAVAAASAAGVLIGRRLPHPLAAPLLLLVLAFFQMLASPDTMYDFVVGGWTAEWLGPWMPPSLFSSGEDLLFRPYVERLGYLIGLVLVLGVWAHRLSLIGRLIAIAVGAAFGWAIFQGMENMMDPDQYFWQFDWSGASANQTCVVEDGIEFCAFPMYEEWVGDWQEVVDSVASRVPLDLQLVVQRPTHVRWGANMDLPTDRRMIATTTDWDRRGAPPTERRNLAHRVGLAAVGLPGYEFDPSGGISSETVKFCHADGQARAAAAVWLSLVAAPGADGIVDAGLASRPDAVPVPLFPTSMYRGDVELARAMYDLDLERVSVELNQKWDQVTDPTTTTTELASWFGLAAPEEPDPEKFTHEPCR